MLRRLLALAAVVAACAAKGADAPAQDEAAIRQLNNDYIHAFLDGDVARFKAIIADSFSGVLADGREIDKAGFLVLARTVPDVRDLRLRELTIRQHGDTALVAGLVSYAKGDGTPVRTRYSSFLVRRGDSWVVEWTQWTRVAIP